MPAPSTATWDLLLHERGLLEGPCPLTDGSVVFSDVFMGGVHRWSADTETTVLLPSRRGVGGIVAHADGGLLVSGRDLLHVAPDGTQRVVLEVEGAAGINDIATDHEGRVYAGVLRYRPFAGESPAPGEVWRIERDGSAAAVLDGVTWPNGIAVSPDGATLYVADFASGEVIASDLDGGGRRIAAVAPSGHADGLAVDTEGHVWVALGPGAAVARFQPDGDLERTLGPPASFVTSLAFAGHELFVTTGDAAAGGGALFRTRVDVKGLALTPAQV